MRACGATPPRAALLVTALLWCAAARAQPTEAEREAELFGPAPQPGATEAEAKKEAEREAEREAELFGAELEQPRSPIEDPGLEAPEASELRLGDALAELYDTTDIGGQIFLRLDYMVNPFKYASVLDDGRAPPVPRAGEDQPLSSPNLVDVYLDSRPTSRLRGYVRGRLRYDPTVAEDTRVFGTRPPREQVLLDQLWLKLDVLEVAYLTVGRQPIRWGSGRFWNPTDVMNRQRRDPLAVFDERLGVDMIKVHVPVESLGWNFYAVVSTEELTRPEEAGVGGRAELLLGPAEVAATVAWRRDNPLVVGVDVSTPVWYLDVRAELAMLYDLRTPFFAGEVGTNPIGLPVAERIRDRSDELILQGVAGVETEIRYNDEGDTLLLGVEYFYNDAGYNSDRYYPVLLAAGQFNPLYAGRHYLSAYAMALAPFGWNDTSFIGSFLGNLSDESFLFRFDYRVTFLTRLSFNAYATVHFGNPYGSLRGRFDGREGATDQVLAALDALSSNPLLDEQTAQALRALLAQLGGSDLQSQLELAAALERGQAEAVLEAGVGLRVQF